MADILDQLAQFKQQKAKPASGGDILGQLQAFRSGAAPEGPSVGGFIKNIGTSGLDLVKNTGSAIINAFNPHLEDNTIVNMGKLGVGAVEKLIPGTQGQEYRADAVANFYKQRYGGLGNIAHTLYEDPMGVAADVATVATGVGGAAKLAAKGAELAGATGVAAKAGQVAGAISKAGELVDPIGAAGRAAKPWLRGAAERIIESNVKPTQALRDRNPNVKIGRTILDENLSAGADGEAQANKIVSGLSDEVTRLVQNHPGKLSIRGILPELQDLRDKYMHDPTGADNVVSVDNAIEELMNHPMYSKDVIEPKTTVSTVNTGLVDAQGKPITKQISTTQDVKVGRTTVPQTAAEINTMKRRIYEDNPRAYGERKGASVEADKTTGRVLKGVLDQNVPGVKDVNARQSKVIVARKALHQMAGRNTNKFPFGLMDLGGGMMATAGMATGSGIPAALAAAIIGLKHPTTAFPIAKGLDKLSRGSGALATGGKRAIVAGQVNRASDTGRKLSSDELEARWQAYIKQ